MEKNCIASFYIKLTSNATAIPLPENELISLVRAYRYLDRRKASEVLFGFKYSTLETKKECLSWLVQKKVEDENLINAENTVSQVINFTDEQFCLLANELYFQYKAKDPLFLDVHSIRGLPIGCQKELDALQEKMADSPLLFFLAVKKCVKAKKKPDVSRWIVQLLSNNSASHIMALKSLGFDFNYRVLLNSYSSEIGTLLLSIRQIYVKRQKLLTSQDALVLPLIDLLKQIIELDFQLNMRINQDTLQQKYHHSEKVAIFESDIFLFIERYAGVEYDDPNFGIFAECEQKLEDLGNAIIALLQSRIEYKKVFSEEGSEGILYAAATDTALIQKMFAVQFNCNEAKSAYNSASKAFQRFLLDHFGKM